MGHYQVSPVNYSFEDDDDQDLAFLLNQVILKLEATIPEELGVLDTPSGERCVICLCNWTDLPKGERLTSLPNSQISVSSFD